MAWYSVNREYLPLKIAWMLFGAGFTTIAYYLVTILPEYVGGITSPSTNIGPAVSTMFVQAESVVGMIVFFLLTILVAAVVDRFRKHKVALCVCLVLVVAGVSAIMAIKQYPSIGPFPPSTVTLDCTKHKENIYSDSVIRSCGSDTDSCQVSCQVKYLIEHRSMLCGVGYLPRYLRNRNIHATDCLNVTIVDGNSSDPNIGEMVLNMMTVDPDDRNGCQVYGISMMTTPNQDQFRVPVCQSDVTAYCTYVCYRSLYGKLYVPMVCLAVYYFIVVLLTDLTFRVLGGDNRFQLGSQVFFGTVGAVTALLFMIIATAVGRISAQGTGFDIGIGSKWFALVTALLYLIALGLVVIRLQTEPKSSDPSDDRSVPVYRDPHALYLVVSAIMLGFQASLIDLANSWSEAKMEANSVMTLAVLLLVIAGISYAVSVALMRRCHRVRGYGDLYLILGSVYVIRITIYHIFNLEFHHWIVYVMSITEGFILSTAVAVLLIHTDQIASPSRSATMQAVAFGSYVFVGKMLLGSLIVQQAHTLPHTGRAILVFAISLIVDVAFALYSICYYYKKLPDTIHSESVTEHLLESDSPDYGR